MTTQCLLLVPLGGCNIFHNQPWTSKCGQIATIAYKFLIVPPVGSCRVTQVGLGAGFSSSSFPGSKEKGVGKQTNGSKQSLWRKLMCVHCHCHWLRNSSCETVIEYKSRDGNQTHIILLYNKRCHSVCRCISMRSRNENLS